MRLAQVRVADGVLSAAIVEENGCRLVPGHTTASLVEMAENQDRNLSDLAEELAIGDIVNEPLAIPIRPPEVWACGCTYAPSAEFRDRELGSSEGPYAYVSDPAHRPELFFKGTSRVCVGSNEPIGARADSNFTAPEPELALVLSSRGQVMAYTIANDVSAWDIERENPLYLPQSKVYDRCCALGPVLVTPDEIPDPRELEMTCTIRRKGELLFEGRASVGQLRRTLTELADYLTRSNSVPPATVLLTGTGIIVKQDAALAAGDVVTIEIPEIGRLVNEVVVV